MAPPALDDDLSLSQRVEDFGVDHYQSEHRENERGCLGGIQDEQANNNEHSDHDRQQD
jgi:hypothetical protein